MSFGNFGFSEILIIAVIVLIFFGPRRMPEIGRAIGGAMREFRRGLNEIQRELQEAEKAAKLDADQAGAKAPGAGAKASGAGAQTQEPKSSEAPTPLAAALASPSAWSATETPGDSADSAVGEPAPADDEGGRPPEPVASGEPESSAEDEVTGEPESSAEDEVSGEPETPGRI